MVPVWCSVAECSTARKQQSQNWPLLCTGNSFTRSIHIWNRLVTSTANGIRKKYHSKLIKYSQDWTILREPYQSINQSINQSLVYCVPKSWPETGQLSLPHVGPVVPQGTARSCRSAASNRAGTGCGWPCRWCPDRGHSVRHVILH